MAFIQYRTARVSVPAVGAGALASVSCVWPRAFLDTSYSIAAAINDPAALLGNVVITAKTAAGCTLSVKNIGLSALAGGTASIELTATHD